MEKLELIQPNKSYEKQAIEYIKEFYKLSPKTYLEEKEVDAIIKSMIDESLNENHKRATYGKLKQKNALFNDMYSEDY